MKWYTGTIPEAVAHAQEKKSLFCVAIFGDDDSSTALLTALDSIEVQAVIEKEGIIAVRIDCNSEEYGQFGAIYPNVTSPSIYCITTGGVAVQVIPGSVDSVALKSRFDVALHLHREALVLTSTSGPSQPQPSASSSASVPTTLASSSTVSTSRETSSSPPESSSSDVASASEASEDTQKLPSLEERIERAKVLAIAKQQQKREEEADEARRRETERREAGKKVAELKRWQEEQETKRLADERRKDKQEEAALRERLRKQIAQDRIDREARANAATTAETKPEDNLSNRPAVSAPPPANYTGLARLQFRLPDGSSHTHAFEPDSTLQDVRTYLLSHVDVPPKGFSISIAFPRRALTAQDNGTSLRDLELLPSATLLIIPNPESRLLPGGAGGAAGGVLSMLTAVIQILITPFTFFWTWIRPNGNPQNNEGQLGSGSGGSRIQGRSIPPRRGVGGVTEEDNLRQRRPEPTSDRETNRGGSAGQSFGRPEGNIHRFPTNNSDSDDEQSTYNGNSTQQM